MNLQTQGPLNVSPAMDDSHRLEKIPARLHELAISGLDTTGPVRKAAVRSQSVQCRNRDEWPRGHDLYRSRAEAEHFSRADRTA